MPVLGSAADVEEIVAAHPWDLTPARLVPAMQWLSINRASDIACAVFVHSDGTCQAMHLPPWMAPIPPAAFPVVLRLQRKEHSHDELHDTTMLESENADAATAWSTQKTFPGWARVPQAKTGPGGRKRKTLWRCEGCGVFWHERKRCGHSAVPCRAP